MARLPLFVFGLLLLAALVSPDVRAPTFPIDYSDPASDVVQLNSATGLCEVDENGDCILSPDPSDVNILWLRGRDRGADLNLTIEVKGRARTQANITYVFNLYVDATNQTHWVVNYTDGALSLKTNQTGSPTTDISGNATIWGPNPQSRNQLSVFVNKDLLGGPANISADVNLDATATQRGSPYSYQDFGWQVPGMPGSTPTVLRGIVYEKGTTTPIAGATVALEGGPSVRTDATGFYQFSLSPGTYTLTVSADGYAAATFTVSLTTGQTVTRDVELERPLLSANLLVPILLLLAVVGVAATAFLFLRKRGKDKGPQLVDGIRRP